MSQLTAEIKVLLDDPHLSVTEIAQHFNFPDQSYLSRFSRKIQECHPKNLEVKQDNNIHTIKGNIPLKP